MFNGIRIDRNSYIRNFKGKEITYFRDREMLQYTCDKCDKNYEKQRNGKDIGDTKLMHFCTDCYNFSESTLLSRLKKKSLRPMGSKGNRRIGRTKYTEVYVGKNSFHTKNPNQEWVREHIFIIQEELGHKIPDGYVVHHIDGNKRNNKRENLVLLTTEEHNNAHAKSELIIFELVRNGLIKFNMDTKLYELINTLSDKG